MRKTIVDESNTNITDNSKKRLSPLICCALLFFLALLPRLIYSSNVLDQYERLPGKARNSYNIGYNTNDTPSYLKPAGYLLKGQLAKAVDPLRPIGYPLLVAVTNLNPPTLLTIQAILMSIIPACTYLLVLLFTRSNFLGITSGLLSCLSPTGIALGSLIMADALFSVLFSIIFLTLAYGVYIGSLRLIVVSAFTSGAAILVKPILIFWPIVSVLLFVLLIRTRTGTGEGNYDTLNLFSKYWKHILILFITPFLISTSWAGLNYSLNGVFSVSTIGSLTMRIYLANHVEEWAIAGQRPTGNTLLNKMSILRKRFASLSHGDKNKISRKESYSIIKKYPLKSVQVLVDDALRNYMAGWDYFSRQLPLSKEKNGRLFWFISRWESKIKIIALFPLFFAPFISLLACKVKPSHESQQLRYFLFANSLVFLYFFICAGVTFWTGPRILYPVEIIIISSVLSLFYQLRLTIK